MNSNAHVSISLPATFAAFAAIVLLLTLIQACTADGLLYSAESAAKTTYHEDISVTGGLTREDGALVLPEWQKSLNETGSILQDVRLGDLERAGAVLNSYLQSERSLHSLVSRLDLDDADVGQFDDLNRLNMDSLEQLLNQCREFEELQDLEQQYREAGNTTMLISVQLRMDALRKEIRTNYEGYAGRQDQVVKISQRYGLNTTLYEQSVLAFAEILGEIDRGEDEQAQSIFDIFREINQGAHESGTPPPISFVILPDGLNWMSENPSEYIVTFKISPDRGVYGDVIIISGIVRKTSGTPNIELSEAVYLLQFDKKAYISERNSVIDTSATSVFSETQETTQNLSVGIRVTGFVRDKPFASVDTENEGRFEIKYRIERGAAGVQRIYTWTGLSGDQTFTVIRRNTTTSLATKLKKNNDTLVAECTGNVTTEDGVPVRDLPVEVSVDGWDWWSGQTGEDGNYSISIEGLTPGRHTLTAWSDTEEFPLAESESAPVEVWVPSVFVPVEVNGDTSLLSIVVYLLGIGGAVIGAAFYIRRRRRPEEEEDVTGFGASIGLAGDLPRALTTEEAVAAANALIAEVGDSRELVTRLYPWLVLQLDARNPHLGLLSRTPREIATLFAGQVAGDPLAALVGIHERVRYAGQRPTDDDIHTLREAIVVVLTERQHG